MNYPCNQTDCTIHPTYIEAEKERIIKEEEEKRQQIFPLGSQHSTIDYNGKYFLNSSWSSVSDNSISIVIPCLGHGIRFECFLCQYFIRQDMKSNLIVYDAKNALEK